jgi:hypothetical protein
MSLFFLLYSGRDSSDSFWVNLIGRGYPAPRTKFQMVYSNG